MALISDRLLQTERAPVVLVAQLALSPDQIFSSPDVGALSRKDYCDEKETKEAGSEKKISASSKT